MAFPLAAVPDLRARPDQLVAPVRELRLGRPERRRRRGAPDRPLHLVLPDAAHPRAPADPEQSRVRRGEPHDRRRRIARIMWRHLLPHVVPVLLVWGARRGRHEHPARGRPELHRRRRAGGRSDLRLAARDLVGDDQRAAPVQRPLLHAVADDLPDDRDRADRRLAQPALRRRAARDRAVVATR